MRKPKAAYVISEMSPSDPALFERYRALAPASIGKHRGRYLVHGSASGVIEGDQPAKMIVALEFLSIAAAKGWYESADYAEARAINKNALSDC
jgi:uncharacterized protein (DUF1330 family)